jgi:hypothetical protein
MVTAPVALRDAGSPQPVAANSDPLPEVACAPAPADGASRDAAAAREVVDPGPASTPLRDVACHRGAPRARSPFGAAVAAAIEGGDKNLSSRVSVDELVGLVERAGDDLARLGNPATQRRMAAAYASEVRALREQHDGDRLLSMTLDNLANILEHAPHATEGLTRPAEYATMSSTEKLETWIGRAGEGLRAGGRTFGDWYAPYIHGLVPEPQTYAVVDKIDRFMRRVAGPSASAEPFVMGDLVLKRVAARAPEASTDATNYVVWGHSLGGARTVDITNSLRGRNVRLAMPIDAFQPMTPLAFRDGVDVVNFHQDGILLPGQRHMAREGDNPSKAGLHAELYSEATHRDIVWRLYDRGMFHLAIGQAMFRHAR